MINATERLEFTIATQPAELEQVHGINYRTFVEEIPQHPVNAGRKLVDRFDDRSTYFVCKRGERVVGMVSVQEGRPFSLDAKVAGLDHHLPPGSTPCELRLLAVEPEHRNGVVFRGLVRELARYCIPKGFNVFLISGAVRQLKLYKHLGFVPFGPLVGTPEAPYQPMYLTLDAYRQSTAGVIEEESSTPQPLRFVPGPVDMHPDVVAALALPAVSHRDDAFIRELRQTKALLCRLAGARHAEIVVGTGTLANDMVAMQLAALDQRGLILSNGEFGERLIDHATRAGLRFATERIVWGDAFQGDGLALVLARHADAGWVWLVHHETSTGVLNDLPRVTALCEAKGVKVCVDCVSSLGVVPTRLRGVHLATAVSGKGLASAAGLAVVFHDGAVQTSARVPRYLDLSLYAGAAGVPFTLPSGQLSALRVATERALGAGDFSELRGLTAWTRERLREMGLRPLADDQVACPGMITLTLGSNQSSGAMGDELARAGLAISYGSDYLRARNWIQIALMGQCTRDKVSVLLRALRQRLERA